MPNWDLYNAPDIEPCMAIMRVAGDPEAVTAAVLDGACVVCAAATAGLSDLPRQEACPRALPSGESPSRAAVDGTPAVPAREADRPLPGAPGTGLWPGSGRSTGGAS